MKVSLRPLRIVNTGCLVIITGLAEIMKWYSLYTTLAFL